MKSAVLAISLILTVTSVAIFATAHQTVSSPGLRTGSKTNHDSQGSSQDSQSSDSEQGQGDDEIFQFEKLVGISTPNMTVRGVSGAGRPWTVASGEAKLDQDGKLEINIEGLLLIHTGNSTLNGTTGPVTGVRASLTCEGSGVVASTGVVSLS